MKNTTLHYFTRKATLFFTVTLLSLTVQNKIFGQLAVYPLRTPNAVNNNTPNGEAQVSLTNPNVEALKMLYGTNMEQANHNSTGVRMRTLVSGATAPWPTQPTNGFGFDIPLSPRAGYDMSLTGITVSSDPSQFDVDITGTVFYIVPYFQVDNAGPWYPLAAPQTVSATTTTINFGTINETFYDTHKYTIRFYVYSSTGASDSKSDYFRLINLAFAGTTYQPTAQPVSVTTVSATATGKYTATAAGTYSYSGTQYYLVKQSGFIWSSSPSAITTLDTSASTKTTNGSAGVINSAVTGLNAATTYYIKAYIVTQFGIQYGSILQFTTAPATAPTVTLTLTNVLSNKVTANGAIPDSGGVFVTERGFVYNKNGNPTIASNIGKIISGSGSTPFSELIKNLDPNTNYCFKSYAKNSIDIAYSAEQCITTGPPVPVLTAIPGVIDFGPNFFGASPITVSYILTGKNLTPAAGTITITCPAPFLVSTQAGTGFASSVTVNYNAGKLTATPIYVQLPTSAYGSWGYTSVLNITHAGGGVTAVNADVVKVSGSIEQAPEDVSNRGTEFWTGFAYQEKMKEPAGDAGEAFMALYIATGDQAATVTVSMPGLGGGFAPQTFTIPANSFREVRGFPTGDPNDELNPSNMPDARLYYTGVTNRGIHIVSTGSPVSVWMHTWTTGNSAAACMLFPTNTWNSSYTVQAYGGTSNNSNPNSFFFVIANEDGTKLTFTPANDILAYITGSGGTVFTEGHNAGQVLYQKGVEYKDVITLNKGQIFNAMGFISGATGLDLTGTKISTTCDKKIAVFGGNGRVLVKPLSAAACGSSGSDHLVQQMFPTVAWGTKYLTVPTKTMEYNYYRVVVQDPLVDITIKPASVNATKGPLVNGLYYQFDANVPLEITSASPINVTQFIIQGTCKNASQGNGGQGDPEMIILSPVEQAINKVTVYSAGIKRTGSAQGNYINVLIDKAAIDNKSFVIDGIDFNNVTTRVDTGSNSFSAAPYGSSLVFLKDAFKPHPQNPNYYFAKFKVTPLFAHTISSAYTFNAIAYGAGDGESYGYNAGTLIKNLTSIKFTDNPNGGDTSSTVVRTCKENPVTLKIALPYLTSQVDSIVWVPGGDPRITPNTSMKGAMNGAIAKSDGTIVAEDGRTFNIYTSPVQYTFSDLGVYNFTVIAYGKFKSDCPGEDRQKMIVVVGRDNAYFEPKASCGSPAVTFDNFTTPMAGTDISSWKWEFGDGTTSTDQNPAAHSYNLASGSYYKVKLTTINSVGCNSYYETDVDFGGGLKVEFTKDPLTAICQNGNYKFTDNTVASGTSGTPNKWVWDFGDGSAKVTENGTPTVQTHAYTTAGKYGAKLEVTTNQGCIDTYVDSVTVEATPVAAIDPSPAFVCLGNEVTYTDKSTISIGIVSAWTWTFDDGTTSVDQNPRKTWATSGNHTVTLAVQSAGSCPSTNTATHTINVNAAPIAGFRYDLNCTTRVINFTDTSNGQGGTITKWTWDFGDGSATSTQQNPSHTYAGTGTYNVSLTVETSNGCTSVVAANKQIIIDVAPVADFTLPGNTCLPGATPVFVNGTTISDGTIASVTYSWDFADGSAANTDKDPTHTYAATGNYAVKLTATSAKGCINSVSKTYSSIFAQPVAVIANIAEVCAGGTVTLSSAGSTAAGSSVSGWAWDFGDGGTSTDPNPTHVYAAAGSYTVTLTVSSAAGCTSTATTKTAVVNALPTADFTADVNCTTRSVAFTDASVPNSGTVNNWTWDFGDASAAGTTQNPTHQYANEGNFTVTLTVKTDKGCTSSAPASKSITIAAAPVVDFDLPGNLCLPNATGTFTNKTTISDGTIALVTYAWDFGDGQSSTQTSPPNTYAAVGPFSVKLTATSNQGCISSSTKSYNAVYAQPAAVITSPAGVCLGNNTNFSSSQSAAPASSVTGWDWDFGDGGTSAIQNPVYVYASAGNKTVTLTVTSQAGCTSAPVTQSFDVNLSPVPNFTFSAIRCADSVITFDDASVSNATGGITEYTWNFGDGSTPLIQTALAPATHTFATAQSYTVSLELKNANGCLSAAAYSVPVVINPNPVSSFTVSDICIPAGNAQFTETASISSGSVTGWNWDFGDGNGFTDNSANPLHIYNTGGEYNVILKSTSDQGCAALITTAVKAYNVPTPLFSITGTNTALCSNLPVSISDQSAVTGYGSVSKVEIYWDFLANPTAKEVINAPSPNGTYDHQYTEFGIPATQTNRLMIRAFSGNGCTADYYQDISLLASPKVEFTQPAPVCQEAQAFNLNGASDIYNLTGSGAYTGNGITASPEFSPAQSGFGSHTIRYTYTTETGCVSFAEKQLVVNPTPVIDFGGTEINVLEGDIMNLSPSISYGATYLWTPSTYLNNPASPKPSGLPINDITYTLAVTSDKGCFDEETVFVRVVRNYIVPNTFTPNNDNIHDSWEISNLRYYPSVRVRVYNRSGQMVFESLGYNTPWNGKYKGKDMPFGTYYYVIETGGGRKPRTGYVTILK